MHGVILNIRILKKQINSMMADDNGYNKAYVEEYGFDDFEDILKTWAKTICMKKNL